MATIRPDDLPAASSVNPASAIIVDDGVAVQKATAIQVVDAAIPLASQAEAEAGANNTKRTTPLRVKQAIEALAATPADIERVDGRTLVSAYEEGVVGDGVTDDTVALQSLFDSGNTAIRLGAGLSIKITDTVTLPAGVSLDFVDSEIVYSGTRDRIAVEAGEVGVTNYAWFRNVRIRAAVQDWSSDNFIGLRAINMQRTHIHIARIEKFTRNFERYANGMGYTLVRHHIDALTDGKYNETLTVDGSTGETYVNENTAFGGDYTTITEQAGDAYMIHTRLINGADSPVNANIWYGPCFQPGNGGGSDDRGILHSEGGANENIIRDARLEGGNGPVALIEGPVGDGTTASIVTTGNIITLKSFSAAGGAPEFAIEQTGSARNNILEHTTDPTYSTSEVAFTDLQKKIKGYSSGNITAVGGLHLTTNDGEPVLFVGVDAMETERDSIAFNGSGRSIGFFVDVEGGESFVAWAKTKTGFQTFLGIAAYDAAGVRLTDASPSAPDVVGGNTGQYNWWIADMGGAYITGSATDAFAFSVSSAVKKIRVFVQGGKVQAFGLRRVSHGATPLSPSSGLLASDATHYCAGNPTAADVGVFGRGDLALLDNASGAGLDAYQFTLGGYGAKDWAISTAYAVGKLRANGGNVYEVTTAGTSAGAGGPSGTGTGIVDGTVTWRYVGTQAVATLV